MDDDFEDNLSSDEVEDIEENSEELDDDDDDNDDNHEFVNPMLEKNKVKKHPYKIIRVVPDDQRITSEIIQLPEMVEAIGIRCSEIENGSPIFTDYDGLTDAIEISKKEFYDRKSPLILQRHIGQTELNGVITKLVEEWRVREMSYPIMDREVYKEKFAERYQPKSPEIKKVVKTKTIKKK
jgi:hypothetical protein